MLFFFERAIEKYNILATSNLNCNSKTIMVKKLMLFIGLSSLSAFSQIGGDYSYQFLNLPSSPVQASLGGKNITIRDNNVNHSFVNPAAINSKMSNQLALNFSKYYGAITYGSAAYVKSFDNEKNVFFGVNYVNYGDIEGYDEFGNETGIFSGNEVALNVGYSYNISQTNWYFGANTKFIGSYLESYSSVGVALDLGVLNVNEENNLTFAFTIRNLGAQISTYTDVREKLPLDIMLAVSKKLDNVPLRWHIGLDNLQKWNLSFSNPNRSETDLEGVVKEEDITFFNNAIRHLVFGVELFPERNFNIRLGYNFRKGEELRVIEQRHFSGITAGFGFKVNRMRFEYSYSRQTIAANTSLFGLSIDLK